MSIKSVKKFSFVNFAIDYIAEAHARGIEVNPWTANKPGIIQNLVEWGSDNIITDVPDIGLSKLK